MLTYCRRRGLDSKTRDEYIGTIERCSNQLLHLIDDIIDVAKIEAGEIKIKKSPISLVQLVRDTATTMEKYKADKGTGLSC
ncbi:histidine kinase dimerization/phospho-acceptor domain-containing protein [Pelagicoccus sp. SDUM812002]|uniref:histidine kinase dimerization/phospho-acceptor domain-containing protein n=1 Tax=Pelagicoccus sp. SDUM812002 TaxID=3041266 RepID=UPI0034E2CBE9